MLTEDDIASLLEFGEIDARAAAALRFRLQMNRAEAQHPLILAALTSGQEGRSPAVGEEEARAA